METVTPAELVPSSSTNGTRSGLLRSVAAKLGRVRKSSGPRGPSDAKEKNAQLQRQKQEYLDDYTAAAVSLLGRSEEKGHNYKAKQLLLQRQLVGDEGGGKDHETLLAGVFACVSAIKAAYAEIQVAQNPYDPGKIQVADLTVVDELRRVSQLKQGYYQTRNHPRVLQAGDTTAAAASSQLEAEVREKKNLVKAYEITAMKLEAELQSKDHEVDELRERLREIDRKNRALEHRLRHTGSDSSVSPAHCPAVSPNLLATLEGFHLSALNPTHFLVALRYAVKSVRDFVGVLVREMEAAGWDLSLAAAAITPCAAPDAGAPPGARDLAFQSYVSMGMFSDFHLGPGFRAPTPLAADTGNDDDMGASSTVSSIDLRRRQCFEEFAAGRSCTSAKDLARLRRPFAEFCRTKYAAIVRPEMEAAFFAGMDRRAVADAELFVSFAEMSRRVWLLHWLFCSFEPEAGASVFRAVPGTRLSEVYMDSVASASPAAAEVGFTVVPGFRIRRTVFQCKVYLA